MAIKKSTRFEVFKRDKFTCQYCGRSAPDVILEPDHIQPRAKGGDDDILNLVTACKDCNSGKSDKTLDDDSAIQKRRRQLEEMEERREQLEMMMEWHKSLIDLDEQVIEHIADIWSEQVPSYHLNERGLRTAKKWLRRFSAHDILEAMRDSVIAYLKYDDDAEDPTIPTKESVEKAWQYIPRIIVTKKREKDKPYLRGLYYTRGILRNRCSYVNDWEVLDFMERAHLAGASIDLIQSIAKRTDRYMDFLDEMQVLIDHSPITEPKNGNEAL